MNPNQETLLVDKVINLIETNDFGDPQQTYFGSICISRPKMRLTITYGYQTIFDEPSSHPGAQRIIRALEARIYRHKVRTSKIRSEAIERFLKEK